MVMKESSKCRSGRVSDRTVSTRPRGLGGKMSRAFSGDEGVAAQGDRDVVMPAAERSSLEVVEPQLALHVLVHALGAPALFEKIDDVRAWQVGRHGREMKAPRLGLVVTPLADEPHVLALRWIGAVVMRRHDALEREARGELPLAAFAPRVPAKALRHRDIAGADRIAVPSAERVEAPEGQRRRDADTVVETVVSKRGPPIARVSVRRVREDDPARHVVGD